MSTASAIITSHNYARYLPEAVESALAQLGGDIEVIVVDDGSTDDTPQVMERFAGSVRYIRQKNQGVSAARNHGISESRGRWIAFLDADDRWKPEKLARQLDALARHPDCRASYTGYEAIGPAFGPAAEPPSLPADLATLVERGNVITCASSVVCDRALFAELGNFDVALSDCADWDMWIRIATITRFAAVDEPLLVYRRHESNMTRNVGLRERDSVRLLDKAFAMRSLPETLRVRRDAIFAHNFMVLAGSHFHAGNYRDAARCAAQAIVRDVSQVTYAMRWPFRAFARSGVRTTGSAPS